MYVENFVHNVPARSIRSEILGYHVILYIKKKRKGKREMGQDNVLY
jgi:hypothetical protein